MTPLPDFLIRRNPESHKGTYGHALLIAGSYGKMGAAILAAKACMRAGAGLLTVHIPRYGVTAMQSAFPEAMVSIDNDNEVFTTLPHRLESYDAIAVGPGLGTDVRTVFALTELLKSLQPRHPVRLILDADALNIAASHAETIYPILPPDTILTPHAREFDRLWSQSYHPTTSPVFPTAEARLQEVQQFAVTHNVVVLHKGHHSTIAGPDGQLHFNTTGNAGMATAGSGDVLTGILLGIAVQMRRAEINNPTTDPDATIRTNDIFTQTEMTKNPFSATQNAILGAFFHGKSGDFAAQTQSECTLIATDIIENLKYVIN